MNTPGTTRHRGQIVDLFRRRVFPGYIEVTDGKIAAVREDHSVTEQSYLCPGFVDAHVHIESSMLTPPEFARIAVIHGTVATVSDPHEIANVMGLEGVRLMHDEALMQPVNIYTQMPSCAPSAPGLETTGFEIGPEDVAEARRLINDRAAVLIKLEKPAAIEHLEELIEMTDAVKSRQ